MSFRQAKAAAPAGPPPAAAASDYLYTVAEVAKGISASAVVEVRVERLEAAQRSAGAAARVRALVADATDRIDVVGWGEAAAAAVGSMHVGQWYRLSGFSVADAAVDFRLSQHSSELRAGKRFATALLTGREAWKVAAAPTTPLADIASQEQQQPNYDVLVVVEAVEPAAASPAAPSHRAQQQVLQVADTSGLSAKLLLTGGHAEPAAAAAMLGHALRAQHVRLGDMEGAACLVATKQSQLSVEHGSEADAVLSWRAAHSGELPSLAAALGSRFVTFSQADAKAPSAGASVHSMQVQIVHVRRDQLVFVEVCPACVQQKLVRLPGQRGLRCEACGATPAAAAYQYRLRMEVADAEGRREWLGVTDAAAKELFGAPAADLVQVQQQSAEEYREKLAALENWSFDARVKRSPMRSAEGAVKVWWDVLSAANVH